MMKKQLIMEKALELFATQGFDATTVQQITDYCGISKGAFYLSFKSKDELILAIIDQFMMEYTSDIDHIVRSPENNLLYDFYYTTFHSFHKHSNFAKILMKEQSHSFNKDFFLKMRHYDTLIDKSLLLLIERLYGKGIDPIKYDLIFCIKGFMHTYSQLFLFYNSPLDLKHLSQSLVEKTNLLAKQMTVPFISHELFQILKQPLNEEITKDQLIEIIEEKIADIEEPIEKESLILLKQQLLNPTLSPAIVKGLLENIRNHSECKWVSYLLRNYFEV
ncbi:TetR/AcrR family transcriptional regulator [Cytobacillus depressus]|uniref:TetR/AcrR family transcriptional regulator n=1 Tax=Cytobacillus depressus TaxID=1602942 RepID=A0A6L3V360_9BACI|nr:TetR/AcrR family transcriptional regulator [Cytobacillus depressus]KAB2334418.1 TetR/AcrR family transcriptional regulator [Cytobacillus depressus]